MIVLLGLDRTASPRYVWEEVTGVGLGDGFHPEARESRPRAKLR